MLMKSTKFPCSYWRISAGTVYIVVFVQSDNPCFSLFVICAYCIFHLLIINIKFVSRLGLLDELIIEFRDQTIWRSMVLLLYEIWLWTLSSINYSNSRAMADTLLLVVRGWIRAVCNGDTDVLSYQLSHVKDKFIRLILIHWILTRGQFRIFCLWKIIGILSSWNNTIYRMGQPAMTILLIILYMWQGDLSSCSQQCSIIGNCPC